MTTILAFHAHPDDEVLFTGGTLARLAELEASAARLGAARVAHLGYADSGHGPVLYPDPPGQVRFARADLDEAAARLAALIVEERAEVLLSYDPSGISGHRDHVRVHEVGARAAELAGSVRVLEATAPRQLLSVLTSPARALRRLAGRRPPDDVRLAGTPRAAITHRIDVRRFAAAKQAALAAHRTQAGRQGRSGRLFRLLIALPAPVFGLLAGREWFTEPGAPPGPYRRDIP